MRQVIQSLQSGATTIVDVPAPAPVAKHVLVRTHASLVSAGTEKMLVDFGRASLVQKVRSQPERVRQVVDKALTDGILPTLEAVRSKLDQPIPMGYSNAGVVVAVGPGVEGLSIGDRVVSNGGHAELVRVPQNLCARVPDGVDDEDAAFAVLGAIALQGIRLARPTLGESFVVTGLGLIGLLAVQLLRANGCRVLGVDFDRTKLDLARRFGAEVVDLARGEGPVAAAMAFSRGRGVDGVLITASTSSSEPVHQAALMSRKRGRIILVGVTGLELSRADFYEKELSFQVSCSYGPGRYDARYEQEGQDYPIGFVRWTEQRNFEAVLDMLAAGALDVKPLITHRFDFAEAERAYALLADGKSSIGIVLEYDRETQTEALVRRSIEIAPSRSATGAAGRAVVGVIGAGNYAGRVLIPALAGTGATLQTVAVSGGISGVHHGRKLGFAQATTDVSALLNDPQLNAVVIATRHDTHARLVCDALRAGKHVFVEKPLALTLDELDEIEATYGASDGQPPLLMIGFNRRFAPHVIRMRQLLSGVHEPKSLVVTVNSGEIPADHWTQDVRVGGGRIVGEGCHFVDLIRYLVGAPITGFQVATIGGELPVHDDKATFTLRFADGSFGSVHYLANGHKSFPKERVEVFTAGRVLQLDNFRILRGYGWPGFGRMRLFRQDKGNTACVGAFVEAVARGGAPPVPLAELLEVSRYSIEIAEAARA